MKANWFIAAVASCSLVFINCTPAFALNMAYTIQYYVNNGVNNAEISGYIITDGVTNRPIMQNDLVSFLLSSGAGTAIGAISISGNSLIANDAGDLNFDVGDNSDSINFYTSMLKHVGYIGGTQYAANNLFADPNTYTHLDSGDVFTLGKVLGPAPTPLPASAPLFGAALVVLGGAAYARRRTKPRQIA